MRLTVLGGSSASPNPGMGCSGYLVKTGATRLVVDLGPGTLPELRRHTDFRRLSGIVISHLHVDHVLDLLALRHALAYNPEPAPGPIPVWLPPGGTVFLAQATAPFDACDEPGTFDRTVTIREYDPRTGITIGEISVTFAPTVHYIPAFAMRLTGPCGAAIGYTADTGPTADLTGLFSDVDLLIAEATLLEPGPQPIAGRGSLTAGEAGELARESGAKALLLTHMNQERGFAAARRQAATVYPGRIDLARPGLSIDLKPGRADDPRAS